MSDYASDVSYSFFTSALQDATSPQPTNATKKPLDSSARNSLIYIGLPSKPCGLTAVLNGAGAERECENGEKTCRPAAEVARYEVRKNPQEPAQTRGSRQKKANWRTSWFFNLVVVCYPCANGLGIEFPGPD